MKIFCLISSIALFAAIADQASAQPDNAHIWWCEFEGDNGPSSEHFFDVYLKEDGGYIAVGRTGRANIRDPSGFYICNLDRAGAKLWERSYSQDEWPVNDFAWSVIELDDGGFAVGGRSGPAGRIPVKFCVVRLDPEGEIVWANRYNERYDYWGNCYAVIETKEGNILAAGDAMEREAYPGHQYAVMIDPEGDVIWEYYSDVGDEGEFHGLREVEDEGFVLAGSCRGNKEIIKLNQRGELIWAREYQRPFHSLVSCIQGGFALSSISGDGFAIQRVDDDGNHIWRAVREIDHPTPAWNTGCVAQLPDGGFAMVGLSDRNCPTIWRTDGQGNTLWWRVDHYGHPRNGDEEYRAVIVAPDGGIVTAGRAYNETRPDTSWDAFIVKLLPDHGPPGIVEMFPPDHDLTILQGDSILFWVRAIDLQEDSIRYEWTLNDSAISERDSVMIAFEEFGEYIVGCMVSDEDLGDSALWRVEATDIYIEDFSPDTLQIGIRRGLNASFSLDEVRALPGEGISYFWTLTDLGEMENRSIGETQEVEVAFPFSGEYELMGMAYQGGAEDAVNWRISVRGAIWNYFPEELTLVVPVGSERLFEVFPTNPQSDSLDYSWFMGAALDEHVSDLSSAIVRLDEVGDTRLMAVLWDGHERDAVIWNISVQEAAGAVKERNLPKEVTLDSPSPNPFNQSSTIRYSLPQDGVARISLCDLTGRELSVLANSWVKAGLHTCQLDAASGFPSGVFFLRLEAGGETRMVKAALLR